MERGIQVMGMEGWGQGGERFLSEEAAMVIVKVDFRVVKLVSFR